jgi:beta-lactamase regulating signal transducer with metallopeptidase domain
VSELAFLVVGLVALFGVSVPLLTLASKALLTLRRRRMDGIADFGSTPNYLLIVGPVLLPVLWVVSAGLHQSEAGWFAGANGAAHLAGQACWNALMLGVVAALTMAVALLRSRRRLGAVSTRQACTHADRDRAERVASVCESHPVLARLRRRVLVVDRDGDQACTTGIVRPVIEISCRLVDSLDDHALQGALLHEAEHVRGLDPLRYLVGSVMLSLNPFGWLLTGELRRWRLAREARCDRGAVSRGASPLSLAEALLVAVRAGTATSPARPALAHRAEGIFLRLRIQLLLGYASSRAVVPSRILPVMMSAIAVVLLTAWLPHAFAAWPLDGLHSIVDATVAGVGQL